MAETISRQQKRAEIRKLAKQINRCQKLGLLQKKTPKWQMIRDFLSKKPKEE